MKGSLHTDELMGEVVARTAAAHRPPPLPRLHGRRAYPHPLLITDAAINIEPPWPTRCTSSRTPSNWRS
jgi:phosphate acetyltransferase